MSSRRRGRHFSGPGRINVAAGTYRSVGLGDSVSDVEALFGLTSAERDAPVLPADESVGDNAGPPSGGLVGAGPGVEDTIYRYQHVVFVAQDDEIGYVGIDEKGATIERGVRIGGALASAKSAYPSLRCGMTTKGESTFRYPGCTGKVGQWFVWFGGDPIEHVELGTAPFAL
jgi:hypothetical protein